MKQLLTQVQREMKRSFAVVYGLVALFLLLSVFYALFKLCVAAARFFQQANPSVSAALIALMATVVGGVVVTSLTQIYNQRREREDAHRAKKIEMYSGYVELLRRVLAEGNENLQGLKFGDGELVMRLSEIKRDLIFWASPDVIKAQLYFEAVASDTDKSFVGVDRLLKAIRKDVGLSSRGLNSMELMKMQIRAEDWHRLK